MEQMNYTLMPSLERRALIKIAIALWNLDAIHLDDIEWRYRKWNAEDHVIEKVKQLPLPESLKRKISGFIKPIGFQILQWIHHYQNILSNSAIEGRIVWSVTKKSLIDVKLVEKSLSKLCWTPQGTVDRKKTAEALIRDENLDIAKRYRLACIYCLRNDILMLWDKMPEYCRKSFYSEEDPFNVKFDQYRLVVFWTYDIKGELTRMDDSIFPFETTYEWPHNCTPYVYAFVYAASLHEKVATEYFWQNLTAEEREKALVINASLVCHPDFPLFPEDVDILFFLLSQMSEEQQLDVLKDFSRTLLSSLLNWPWQDIFMETAKHVRTFLSGYDYLILLECILDRVKFGYKDYDYKKLFREFWQNIPITYKEYVRDECARTDLLEYLFDIEDKEYFKIIFASIPDREKLLFSYAGERFCRHLIFYDKMDLLEAFIRECISSKDIIIKFREEFEYFMSRRTLKEQTDKFFQLLDELILEYDKKKCADEGNTDPAAKRLCSHNKRITQQL